MPYVYTEPVTQSKSASLPNPWHDTREGHEGETVSGLSRYNCLRFGWAVDWIEPTPVETVRKYSKLKLIRALKSLGAWDAVKQAIEDNGLKDEWDAAEYMASDDAEFMGMLEQIAVSVPGFDVAGLLAQCEWEE